MENNIKAEIEYVSDVAGYNIDTIKQMYGNQILSAYNKIEQLTQSIETKNSQEESCIRINDIELRIYKNKKGEVTTAEIVKWYEDKAEKKEYCYTLAYWEELDDNYCLIFVSDRPFNKDINKDIFWFIAERGQELLKNKINTESLLERIKLNY